MGSLSIWHWIVVIAVVLLLFGRGKISDLMGDVAQGRLSHESEERRERLQILVRGVGQNGSA